MHQSNATAATSPIWLSLVMADPQPSCPAAIMAAKTRQCKHWRATI